MACVNIIGAGLAGLTAAITLAERGQQCCLISLQPSERAQSVLAEGGINAALDTMGEGDTVREHFEDTMAGGAWLADPEAVRGLTEHAPEIVGWLCELGVPFHREEGRVVQRNFGGQKKKRTTYAKSSTGKVIVSALADEARKYEARGLIRRYSHHAFVRLLLVQQETAGTVRNTENIAGAARNTENITGTARNTENIAGTVGSAEIIVAGVRVKDIYSSQVHDFAGPVILASGGLNGFFPGRTTGTTANSGDVTAIAHAQGVSLANLEMIQYHPTTIGISGKRCLISEAARGEGGRLFVMRGGKPWYFMEEKYPELGNLMPRDVVSREMYGVVHSGKCQNQVFLDLTGIKPQIWRSKLPELREEIVQYLSIDPKREPVPVSPGIHYFMGGIRVDRFHRTNLRGLWAAGECACQYHGANRLGGNSMLGAIYGGRVAAEQSFLEGIRGPGMEKNVNGLSHFHQEDVSADSMRASNMEEASDKLNERLMMDSNMEEASEQLNQRHMRDPYLEEASEQLNHRLGEILAEGMGIVRNETGLNTALQKLHSLKREAVNEREYARLLLGEEMLRAAIERRESLGAHYREDSAGVMG